MFIIGIDHFFIAFISHGFFLLFVLLRVKPLLKNDCGGNFVDVLLSFQPADVSLNQRFFRRNGRQPLILEKNFEAGLGELCAESADLFRLEPYKRDREREAQEAERAQREQAEQLKRQQAEAERKKKEEASKIPLTGDKAADQVILTGQDMLATIRKENEAIPDQELSELMDNLSIKCEQIFRTVSETPSKAPQVRKFMNYYLPTTLKMLANYRTMQQRGVSYGEMQDARQTTVRGMNLVLTACQKLIDNLHRDNMLDISTDIDVLEQMLKRDGFTDNEIVENARTAAEAQLRASSVPMIQFPAEQEADNYPAAQARREEN